MTIRSQQKIVTRIWALRAHRGGILGFREEVLVEALDLQHARQVITPHQFDLIDWSVGRSIVGADTARATSTPTSTRQRRPDVSP
ncbi:hypothetical protein ACFFWC_21820 [Plantactinospora siamensis]|uniref:Uncharacterized protein n=1 Tax=Plantactinospora siamensis TaxID=555372 RepID=A0ABV6P5A4_9ACTN